MSVNAKQSISFNLKGLSLLIKKRIQDFFIEDSIEKEQDDIIESSFFNNHFTILNHQLSNEEQLILLTALIPHIQPNFFDTIIQQYLPSAGDFPQIGGIRGKNFRGFLPTGETILFLLAGSNLSKRMAIQTYFSESHFFAKNNILWLKGTPEGEPKMSGQLILSQEHVDLLTTGNITRPRFGLEFPAQYIETNLEWEDLILKDETLEQIKELQVFINHGSTMMKEWGMERKLKPGYRSLFYGPPGTGKTLTASLLGKYTGKEVYKIDLSMIVSKFIGETEKNLSKLFSKAENKDWILFFDEADALFGKRTNVRDAHDKYANQEVSYLLQRVENYNGLVILASNFKSNIDDAFVRRFQSIIQFHPPDRKERFELWTKGFPNNISLSEDINITSIAAKYELTGASIMNVIQFACLRVLERGDSHFQLDDLLQGIRKEYAKEGRRLR